MAPILQWTPGNPVNQGCHLSLTSFAIIQKQAFGCKAIHLTGFCMLTTLALSGLNLQALLVFFFRFYLNFNPKG